MYLYRAVNRLLWRDSYLAKILLVSFLGVHVPIIGAVTYILLASGRGVMENLDIVLAMLVATLLGTIATLVIHYGLLAPVRNAARALDRYLENRTVPSLPTKYPDEAGVLMANVQEAVTRLDLALDALQAEKEAESQRVQDKLALLGGMSHELRTPLNHIIGFAEMMSNEVMGPLGGDKYRDYAEGIGASGADLMETVKSLMEIGEAETAGALAPEAVGLDEPLEHAIALAHFNADRRDIVIRRGPMESGLACQTDPRALKQALTHLMQVAVATAADGAVCAVSAGRTEGGVEIAIRSGGGRWKMDDLPPELRRQVDGDFYSDANDADEIPTVTGNAVRLSLVTTLMRITGGELSVSQDEGGRTARLVVPAADRLERAA